MGFLANFSRVGLTVYNVFFFIYGLIIFILFFVIKAGADSENVQIPAIKTLLWLTALVVLVSSVIGCCVVQTKKPVLILFYAVLILICIVFQISFAGTVYKQSGDIVHQLFKNQIADGFGKLANQTQIFYQQIQQEHRLVFTNGKFTNLLKLSRQSILKNS